MKTFLTTTLILIIFFTLATYASASPPHLIFINGAEELTEIRKMAEAGEKEFLNFREQTGQRTFNGFINFDEIKIFLSVLDSLPIPIIGGKELSIRTITYNFDGKIITDISYDSDDGETYIYFFNIAEHRPLTVREFIEERYNEKAILLYQREDGNVKIYAYPQSIFNEARFNRFVMDFYGSFVWVTYLHEDITDYSSVCAEELLGNVTRGFVNVLEEMHERRNILTTSDALTVLRAVAGLTTLTDAQIARFGISGEPTSADAMRILRFIAGFPSVIDRDERAREAADVNGDGVINIADAMAILKIVAGLA
jgi:hypothetical protein